VGEAFLKTYKKVYDLDYTIFRFFNTYGPDQSQDFVMSKFINAALRNEPITLYGDGSQTRTFCFVDDNIETTTMALYNDLFVNDVVNVGSDIEMSIKQLAEKVVALTGSASEIIHLPALTEGDMTRRKPDNSKMKAILNRPLVTVDEGIQIMIQHIKQTL
jgi:UDP-glucose 4-epimerase